MATICTPSTHRKTIFVCSIFGELLGFAAIILGVIIQAITLGLSTSPGDASPPDALKTSAGILIGHGVALVFVSAAGCFINLITGFVGLMAFLVGVVLLFLFEMFAGIMVHYFINEKVNEWAVQYAKCTNCQDNGSMATLDVVYRPLVFYIAAIGIHVILLIALYRLIRDLTSTDPFKSRNPGRNQSASMENLTPATNISRNSRWVSAWVRSTLPPLHGHTRTPENSKMRPRSTSVTFASPVYEEFTPSRTRSPQTGSFRSVLSILKGAGSGGRKQWTPSKRNQRSHSESTQFDETEGSYNFSPPPKMPVFNDSEFSADGPRAKNTSARFVTKRQILQNFGDSDVGNWDDPDNTLMSTMPAQDELFPPKNSYSRNIDSVDRYNQMNSAACSLHNRGCSMEPKHVSAIEINNSSRFRRHSTDGSLPESLKEDDSLQKCEVPKKGRTKRHTGDPSNIGSRVHVMSRDGIPLAYPIHRAIQRMRERYPDRCGTGGHQNNAGTRPWVVPDILVTKASSEGTDSADKGRRQCTAPVASGGTPYPHPNLKHKLNVRRPPAPNPNRQAQHAMIAKFMGKVSKNTGTSCGVVPKYALDENCNVTKDLYNCSEGIGRSSGMPPRGRSSKLNIPSTSL